MHPNSVLILGASILFLSSQPAVARDAYSDSFDQLIASTSQEQVESKSSVIDKFTEVVDVILPHRNENEESFVKGNISGVGDVDFYVPRQQVFVGSTYFYTSELLPDGQVHRVHYLGAVPRLSLYHNGLYASFEVPLAFEIYDYVSDPGDLSASPSGNQFANAGTFAGFMWDEPGEIAQVIRYLRYGGKEQPLYVNVSKVASSTVGHGTILRRYNGNIDLEHRMVGAQVDYAHDYGGFEFQTNNVVTHDIVGLLAFFRPGAALMPDNLFVRSASLGLSLAVDRHAPLELAINDQGDLISDAKARPTVDVARALPILGVDGEVKVFKNSLMDVKTYGDFSWIALDGGSGGASMGALTRMNLLKKEGKARHALRGRAEAQLFGAHYDPGYFDLFYEVEKYQSGVDEEGNPVTKLETILEREEGVHVGGRLEGSYAWVDKAAITLAVEKNTAQDNMALVHVEVPAAKYLKLLGTAARVGSSAIAGGSDSRSYLLARANLMPFNWMMIGAEVNQLYRLSSVENTARPLEGEGARFTSTTSWAMDFALGFEF